MLERVKAGRQTSGVSEAAELGPETRAGPRLHYGKTAGDSDLRNDDRSSWRKEKDPE